MLTGLAAGVYLDFNNGIDPSLLLWATDQLRRVKERVCDPHRMALQARGKLGEKQLDALVVALPCLMVGLVPVMKYKMSREK